MFAGVSQSIGFKIKKPLLNQSFKRLDKSKSIFLKFGYLLMIFNSFSLSLTNFIVPFVEEFKRLNISDLFVSEIFLMSLYELKSLFCLYFYKVSWSELISKS